MLFFQVIGVSSTASKNAGSMRRVLCRSHSVCLANGLKRDGKASLARVSLPGRYWCCSHFSLAILPWGLTDDEGSRGRRRFIFNAAPRRP